MGLSRTQVGTRRCGFLFGVPAVSIKSYPECELCLASKEEVSYGSWSNEEDSVAFLRSVIKQSGLFTIYSEVEGEILQPRMDCEDKSVRIDMILSPTQKAISAGWRSGPLGVECKKSGIKLNIPFLQVDDYTRAAWNLKNGFKIMCQYYFIWPFRKTHGFAASLMAQKRIGTLEHVEGRFVDVQLKFFTGEMKALTWTKQDDSVSVGELKSGSKVGSR